MKLTDAHRDILNHTYGHNFYCGDSPEMQELVKHCLMKCVGKKSICDDLYFDITCDGKAVRDMAAKARSMGKILSIEECP